MIVEFDKENQESVNDQVMKNAKTSNRQSKEYRLHQEDSVGIQMIQKNSQSHHKISKTQQSSSKCSKKNDKWMKELLRRKACAEINGFSQAFQSQSTL